jgi:RHS repeat-associated protein
VLTTNLGATTTYIVGAHYEVTDGVVTKYCFAGAQRVAMRKGSTLSYLLGDHLGSTSITTNTSGTLVSEMRYKPWGETRYTSGTTPTQYQYTGQRNDSYINLLWYGSRHYDPELGRFIQPDSIVPTFVQGVQAYDRFAYVSNNPVRYNDPTGHCPTCLIGAIGGAIILTAVVYATHPDLAPQEYVRAALVGATAGLLIGTGVGIEAGGAIAAAYVGAGIGGLTAAGAYTVTAGDSYDGQEMAANAVIGEVTGAATALLGPEALGVKLASSTEAIVARTGFNMLGAQTSQIVHNEYFDEEYPSYPPPSESVGAAMAGGLGSGFGEVLDSAVTSLTGSKILGSLTYNTVKNFAVSIQVNRFLNYMDNCDDEGMC